MNYVRFWGKPRSDDGDDDHGGMLMQTDLMMPAGTPDWKPQPTLVA